MVYNGKLNSEEELIEKIHLLNRQINKEPCRTTGIPRVVMFQKEKEHLKPLTRVPLRVVSQGCGNPDSATNTAGLLSGPRILST